jgi:hypothetical protein
VGTTALTGATGTASQAGTAALDPSLASYGQSALTPQQVSQGVSQGTITPDAATNYGNAFSESFAKNPTVQAPPTTTYSGFGEDSIVKKGATLALPGIGGAMAEGPNQGIPGAEPYRRQATLSPDFQGYTPSQPNPYYRAQYTRYAAGGGLMDLRSFDDENGVAMASGGDTRKKKRAPLTAERTINSLDPYNASLAQLNNARYGANMSGIGALNPTMTSLGELPAVAGAGGGIASLGSYSDGGRMLKGPGDGMSDSIPATIANKRPARLADGEFVVPADVVSHLGNGSTDAGARKLYAMMDKVRRARTGKKKQAPAVNTGRFMPA